MFAAVLTVSAIMAQSPVAQKKAEPAEWPEKAPYNAAIDAFDAAVTRAGWDEDFRNRLIVSVPSARDAVAEEGNIKVPPSKVIVFYEAQNPGATVNASSKKAGTRALVFDPSKTNENIHVFCLPPFNKGDKTKKYTYHECFMGEYDEWLRQ